MQRYEEFFNSPPFYAYLTLTLTHFVLRLGFFLLITNRRPLRRTILQSGVRFFNDALVFILIRIVYLYLNTIRPFVRS